MYKGIILPPIALINNIIIVLNESACFFERTILASKTPKAEQAIAVVKIMIINAGKFIKISRPNASQEKTNMTES